MAMRIVSLVPSITELLVDLGAEHELVGVTKFCIHPVHLRRTKQVIGGTKNVRVDDLLALKPDLVIASKEENVREQVEAIAAHAEVIVTDVADVPSALEMIAQIGHCIHRAQQAESLIAEIQQAFDALRVQTHSKLKTAAYLIWKEPYMVAGSGTYIDNLLGRSGFLNSFAPRTRYPITSLEELTTLCPDRVFLSTEPFPFTDAHVAELSTLLPGSKVQLVDGEMFSWYGSRMREAAAYLRHLQ